MAGKTAQNLSVQDRDVELLFDLFQSRLMALSHVAALHFNGGKETAKKRIQKLKTAGLIGERSRKVNEPAILYLTRRGFSTLKDAGRLSSFPAISWPALERRLHVSELTRNHELQVMTVKAAVTVACAKSPQVSIAEFSTWPALFEFMAAAGDGQDVLVKPDGFIRLHQTDTDGTFEHVFFLEVDRSTEALDRLSRRALCYLNYYQRGGLAERFGRPRSEFREYPFRALMLFKTAERRNNIAEKLLMQNPPILTQVWLATYEEAVSNPLGSIWIRPKDYKAILDGTPHALTEADATAIYRRRTERDEYVAKRVTKHPLLSPTVNDP